MRYFLVLTMALFLSACGGSSSDSSDTTDSTDTTDTSDATNTAPIADAGVDQSVTTGTTVSLDASGSSDADNDTLTYDWATISSPSGSAAALDSTTIANPTFTADVEGSYTFQVSVSDSVETVTDQVTITASTVTVSGTSSTDGIECDYSYSAFNDSASVNTTSTSEWTCSDTTRDLEANGIPDHEVGTFPNAANPNTISEQTVSANITLTPIKTEVSTTIGGPAGNHGYVLNGVKIDPGTGGSCPDNSSDADSCSGGDNSGAWSLEALGYSSFDFFGADENNAHVQPDGTYHYHGMPEGFITKQGGDSSKMTLIGWAADGFPIYARYGYSDATDASSTIKNISGSYQLVTTISDTRPDVDIFELGMFKQDWEYVEGSGDLDECNGRFGVTPEFPNGIYHYYATDSYPYFQRCVKGEVEGAAAGGPPPAAKAEATTMNN